MRHLCSSKEVSLHSLLADGKDDDFLVFNPSVVALRDRLISTLRVSNVERVDRTSKYFLTTPEGTRIQNQIGLAELNGDLSVANFKWVDLSSGWTEQAKSGLEDVRVVASADGRLEGMCCLPSSDYRIKPRGGLGFESGFFCRMARIQFGPGYEISGLTIYESPFKRRMEKNWAPFYVEGKFCVVYQWNPLIILELRPDGTTHFVKWFSSSDELKGLRGSSQGIATANGFLFVVHRKFIAAGRVRFAHQLIELGRDLQPLRMSEPFGFISDKLIEYCAGLALFQERCLFSFGLNDSLPFIAEMPAARVEEMLSKKLAPIAEDAAAMASPGEAAAAVAAKEFPEVLAPSFGQRVKTKCRELATRVLERFLPI